MRNSSGFQKESNLFSYLEVENDLVGLVFANEVEANHFNSKIEERILKKGPEHLNMRQLMLYHQLK